jgi:hypothetical protein
LSKNKPPSFNLSGVIASIVIILVAAGIFLAHDYASIGPNAATSFAGLEALFTGLAFTLLILSLWLQSRELSLQRKALEDQAAQLELLASAQQADLLHQERWAKIQATNDFLRVFGWPEPHVWLTTLNKNSPPRLEEHLNSGALTEPGGWYIQAAVMLELGFLERRLLFERTRAHTTGFVGLLRFYEEREDKELAAWKTTRSRLYKEILEPFSALLESEEAYRAWEAPGVQPVR